jgi:CheY-like chemotaxis protein
MPAPVVLIVDDHEDTREMYVEFLAAMGHAPRAARTCAEALALVASAALDAIVLDRRLPDGDGADVCRTLKADARTRVIPVVMLSGRVEEGVSGADAYLMKPVMPDDLFKVLQRLLASAR